MNCAKRDPDILLLAHGELSGWRALGLRWHLSRCARCQQRYQEWTRVSASLATVLRDPGQAPWKPAVRPLGFRPLMSGGMRLTLFLLGGVLLLAGYVLYHFTIETQSRVPSSGSQIQGGCAPNLPSDRCR